MPINAPQTIPGLQSWAGFYGGNVAAPPSSFSVFGAQQAGAPPSGGVPYSGAWTNPQTWANYYSGSFGFQAPQNAGTPAGALGAELQNPNDPALLGWEQDFGNPQSILSQSKNWAQSLGAPPTSGQYNQGTGGWANPASWAAYYGGKEGFTAPPQAGTPAAALAAAAALSHSSPLDPNLLGWEQDFGQPAQILGNTANWAASLGAPPTNGNYNQGIGAWESPLAWAAYYGGIQGYKQPVDNTLQAAQNFAGFTNKNDPSLLGWELDYGNPQTVVSVIEAQQAAIAAQQAAQQQPPPQSGGTFQQQLAAFQAQQAADNAQLAAFQQQQAANQAQAQNILTEEQAVQAILQNPSLSPTERLAFQAELEGFQAQEGQFTGLVGTLAGEAASEQAQIAALQPPTQPPPNFTPPSGAPSSPAFGTVSPGAIAPGGNSALALQLGLPPNTSPLEVQATEIANASGAGQGFIQLIESNLRQGFPPLTNVFTPLRGPAGISGTAGVGGEGQVGAGTLPFSSGAQNVGGPTITPGPYQPGGFDVGVAGSLPGQPGGIQPSIGGNPGGIGIFQASPFSFGGAGGLSFDTLQTGAGDVLEFQGPPDVTGLGATEEALSPPPAMVPPPFYDPLSGYQMGGDVNPPAPFNMPDVMIPSLPPDMNLPPPSILSPSQQPGAFEQIAGQPIQLPEITVTPEAPQPPPYIALPNVQPVLEPFAPEAGQPPVETMVATDFPDLAFQSALQELGPTEGFPQAPKPSDVSGTFVEGLVAKYGQQITVRQFLTEIGRAGDVANVPGIFLNGLDTPINITQPLEPQITAAIGGLGANQLVTQLLSALQQQGITPAVVQEAIRAAQAGPYVPQPQSFQTGPEFSQNIPLTDQPGQFLAGLPQAQAFPEPNLGPGIPSQPIEAAPADLFSAGLPYWASEQPQAGPPGAYWQDPFATALQNLMSGQAPGESLPQLYSQMTDPINIGAMEWASELAEEALQPGRFPSPGEPAGGTIDYTSLLNQIMDPAMFYNLMWMAGGEVGPGGKDITKAAIIETALNRAMQRDHPLQDVLMTYRADPNVPGYYAAPPVATYKESVAPTQDQLEHFANVILPMILSGQNVANVPGYGPATGNASQGVAASAYKRGWPGVRIPGGVEDIFVEPPINYAPPSRPLFPLGILGR